MSNHTSTVPHGIGRPIALTLLLLLLGAPAQAYVGPGAGFAIVGGAAGVLAAFVLAFAVLLVLPFRLLWRVLTRKSPPKGHVRRLIVVGLDGQDPRLTDRFMAEGKLPNLQKLAEEGCYKRIRTTFPSISPVAWSSFSTGTNPGKHNIFDFLDRDLRSYLPKLSSTYIGRLDRTLKIGRWQIPLKKPEIRLLRKSKPFWTILGEHNIWSTVLRVPITFPPDKFYGAQLAAMCVPDLLGTQGTFHLFTTRESDESFKEGGLRSRLSGGNGVWSGEIEGPENSFLQSGDPLRLPLAIERNGDRGATVRIGRDEYRLEVGQLSDWITLTFPAIPGVKVDGLTRMLLTEAGEDGHVSLYLSPINISPEKPAMPVSHPSYYSAYLSKKLGPFSTLGLAEDTWALNEKVTTDEIFLQQSYDIDKEREQMLFSAMDQLKKGSLVCVFDGTDRIQHMFWRYLEEGHPAAEGIVDPPQKDAIEKLYQHNDALVGRVMDKLREGDMLMVLSDHGFDSFRRGVNLNRWLLDEGYLVLKDDADGRADWLQDVDWSRTKAYSLGLAGIFLNMAGREEHGIVQPGEEATALKDEMSSKLQGLRDPEHDEVAVNEAFDTEKIYNGPYKRNAPDLLIGFNSGYRTSWDCATGQVTTPVFEDNVKAWSGDHCIDPRLVPGVFFCNRAIDVEDPSLLDIAPTALELFGIEPPGFMEGTPLWSRERMATLAKAS